jgi:UDP-N-acetylglucosamine 2-epimerase (non-hydrolysing)
MTGSVHLVAGARPNFMKVAPLYHALAGEAWCARVLVHTGQHYDPQMSGAFFDDLGLPAPDVNLGIGSGTHAEQTAGVMLAYEKLCIAQPPDLVVVVGDVNSTLACTIAAKKLGLPVAHLEAGLRSGDRTMPEEINRIVTDALADVLWTPSVDADTNLRREGVDESRIQRVGNIMIDSFELQRPRIAARKLAAQLALPPDNYGVVTLHRPSNVDDPMVLTALVDSLCAVAERLQLVFVVHPRTRERLRAHGLSDRIAAAKGLRLLEPLGYIDFMSLVTSSLLVITDSGGVQEETTYLGIPCLTVRSTTERPITVTQGTNRLVSASELEQAVTDVLRKGLRNVQRPELWDGRTASRIVALLRERFGRG